MTRLRKGQQLPIAATKLALRRSSLGKRQPVPWALAPGQAGACPGCKQLRRKPKVKTFESFV